VLALRLGARLDKHRPGPAAQKGGLTNGFDKRIGLDRVTVDSKAQVASMATTNGSTALRLDGRALVTGATGLVGSAVTRCLIDAGTRVRALVRSTSPAGNIAGLDIETVVGDLREPDSLRRALADVRYLFHVAADYRLWTRDPESVVETNVTGTRNIMEAALRSGVERVVYTSSVATLALRADGAPSDEMVSLDESQAIGVYKRSKVAAERVVATMVAERKLPAVIVNPTAPIGPRDIRPTPTGRIIIETACGRMPGFVDTGLNLVHVDDVGAGHLLAMQKGRIGERYILGGQNVQLAEMLAKISQLVGRRPPRIRLPYAVVFPYVVAAEALAVLTNREPFATLDGLRMAKHHMFFATEKAERELGYRARPYIDGLSDAIDWFRRNGYLH
jgi:dihydroflavonol-4-reductase